MKAIDELLTKLDACREAKEWAQGKTFEEVYTTCERGEWLNWLFSRTNPEDVQLLTLVKGHQANTVRYLMKDKRSIKAVDTAIEFGEGRATKEELNKAATAAWAAYVAFDAADRAVYNAAAYTAARAASYPSDVADSAARTASYAAADAHAAAARQANLQLTADIFRKYISIDKFKI